MTPKALLTLPAELLAHPGRGAYSALSDKEKLAVDLFVITRNAAKSYREAGYAQGKRKDWGADWFKRDKIAPAVEWLASVKSWAAASGTATEVAGEEGVGGLVRRTLDEIKLLAFSDVSHYTVGAAGNLVVGEGAPPGAMRAISSFKWRTRYEMVGGELTPITEGEIKLWDKPGALRFLGDFLGMLGTKEPAADAGITQTGSAGAIFEVIVQGADGSRTEVRGGARATT